METIILLAKMVGIVIGISVLLVIGTMILNVIIEGQNKEREKRK